MKPNKQVEKLVHMSLNKILKTSKSISKSWKHDGVSMATIKMIVDKSKFSDSVNLDDKFKKTYNEMLDQLVKTCRQQAYRNSVTYSDLKNNIGIMKRSFSKGLNK